MGTYLNSRTGVVAVLETCTPAPVSAVLGREVRPDAGSHGWLPSIAARFMGTDPMFVNSKQRFSKTQLGSRAHSPG